MFPLLCPVCLGYCPVPIPVLGLVAQSCPTLCDPMDCSPPGSSVHGILQARILEWLATPSSRGSSSTQGSNPGFLHCRQILYHLSHQGSPFPVTGELYSLVWFWIESPYAKVFLDPFFFVSLFSYNVTSWDTNTIKREKNFFSLF